MVGEAGRELPEIRDVLLACERLPSYGPSMLALLHAVMRVGRAVRQQLALTAEQLTQLRHPVQQIWGEKDPFGSVDVGRRAAALLRDAELHVVAGGHAPWFDSHRRGRRARAAILYEQRARGNIMKPFVNGTFDLAESLRRVGAGAVVAAATMLATTTGTLPRLRRRRAPHRTKNRLQEYALVAATEQWARGFLTEEQWEEKLVDCCYEAGGEISRSEDGGVGRLCRSRHRRDCLRPPPHHRDPLTQAPRGPSEATVAPVPPPIATVAPGRPPAQVG